MHVAHRANAETQSSKRPGGQSPFEGDDTREVGIRASKPCCLDAPQCGANRAVAGNNSSTVSDGTKDQSKSEKKEKKKEPKEKEKKPQKIRGYSRAIDVIIEDDMATGKLANGEPAPKEKKDHPLAQKLFELRADPNREIEVTMVSANYESGTYANGKSYNKFKKFEYQFEDGIPTFIKDELESGPRKVKDLSDWDLIALDAPEVFNRVAELLHGKSVAYGLVFKLFNWAGKKPDRKLLESSLADAEATWPSLKGTSLIEMIKSADSSTEITQKALLKELSKLPWAQFGPSTTLWWKGKTVPDEAPSSSELN